MRSSSFILEERRLFLTSASPPSSENICYNLEKNTLDFYRKPVRIHDGGKIKNTIFAVGLNAHSLSLHSHF